MYLDSGTLKKSCDTQATYVQNENKLTQLS